ncbi:class I SAM-dependent methyltransferase [Cupriavidus agavae]|uniref:SAM-dependent methyltransferase n=1 Tax=Cupriavidus agavae TaxID=1001822 RepID=A0A4Q7S5C3_9BURK|nr:SAM-dependent methyltransferase [Cupriavidus agavae]RZT41545.1 hypothetical protein EV147_0539 [Cupriavidus agavae]
MTSPNRFANIGFEDFRRLAADESLSKYERIGFPNSYREGFEPAIFEDIRRKLTNLDAREQCVLDIGPGCSDLPRMLMDLCRAQDHRLTLVDSAEMLALLPDAPATDKVAALYPNCPALLDGLRGKVDALLCYSLLHYVLVDVAFFRFLDVSLSLLAPGGQMLIGDIPNVSKRKRFFASDTGIAFHKAFMQTDEPPEVAFNNVEHDQIDDAVVFALLQRARSAGFDAYVVPQNPALPLANRREDILIIRP